jgi:hypothetical protein
VTPIPIEMNASPSAFLAAGGGVECNVHRTHDEEGGAEHRALVERPKSDRPF